MSTQDEWVLVPRGLLEEAASGLQAFAPDETSLTQMRLRSHYAAPPSPDLQAQLAEERQAKERAEAQVARLRHAYSAMNEYIGQVLGKALGYPWFKDDLKNFPDATEDDGVCIGEHMAESIADEAAAKIASLRALIATKDKALRAVKHDHFGGKVGGGDGNTYVVNPISAATYNKVLAALNTGGEADA